jgi:iron complex outermembrane receptor protein
LVVKPTDHFTVYGSISLMHSRLENNYQQSGSAGVADLPVRGKELVLTPDQTFALRGQYEIGPLTIGVQGKYTGQRYITDMNDASLPGFTVVDLDAEWKLEGFGKNTRIQVNAYNINNAQYFTRASTTSAASKTVLSNGGTYGGSTPFVYTGAPPTVYATLKVAF